MNLMTPGRVLTSNKYICNSILCSTYLSNLRRATRTERSARRTKTRRHDTTRWPDEAGLPRRPGVRGEGEGGTSLTQTQTRSLSAYRALIYQIDMLSIDRKLSEIVIFVIVKS